MKAVLALAVVAVLAAGCGGAQRPHFESASGWHTLGAHGELVAADVDLASADRSLASPPIKTVETLPRGGTVIFVLVMRRWKAVDRRFPAVPLTIGRATATNPPEGFFCPPAARTRCFEAGGAIRRMQARDSGWDIDVTIFFGTDHPSSAALTAANTELARLSF